MHLVGEQGQVKRLVVVAENSLVVEAIAIGLRESGAFTLLGHVNPRTGSIQAVIEANPDVVLVDDLDGSAESSRLIAKIKAGNGRLAVIVLSNSMDPAWLDEIFAAGALGAISKATPPAALVTLIRETIDGRVLHVQSGSGLPRAAGATVELAEPTSLTSRELEVLQLVASGATNGEIARKLWVTEKTVKFHLSNVYRKLQVGNRTEASHYAHVNGLVLAADTIAAF